MPQNSITPAEKSEAMTLGGTMKLIETTAQRYTTEMIGIPNVSEAVYYTQQEADAYNAELTGAMNSTDPLTAEQAAAYNEAVTGASKEAGDTLSSAEANAYNATLDGAVTTDDVKTPAVPKKVKDYVDDGLAGKADKLPMTGAGAAVANNLVAIDANGNIKDSGKNQNSFQAPLTFDTTPTANSTNPVTSGGVKAYVDTKNNEQDGKIDVLEQLAGAKLAPDTNLSDPLMTSTSNPEVLAVCYAQGWCADATKMTYVEAMTVTDIGTVFKNNTSITHFEELQWFGITEIKEDAFSGASNLTKIGIPPTVVSFGSNAFNGVSTISEVYIRDLSAFCAIAGRSTNNNMIPNRRAGCKLFLNGVYQTVLQIPEGVTEIPQFCFGCFNFERVIVPKSVVMFKYRAFGNSTIGSVWYKHTLKELGNVTVGAYGDTQPNTPANGQIYVDGVRIEGTVSIPDDADSVSCLAATKIQNIIIPNSVTTIGTSALLGTLLESIDIPNSVTSIGGQAFQNCSDLTSATIGNSVTIIGNSAFDGCGKLSSITIGGSINSILYYVFRSCYLLETIKIYAKTAPSIDPRQPDVGRDVVGSKILYVPSNATGYDTGNWKTVFLDNGWTLSKTLPAA